MKAHLVLVGRVWTGYFLDRFFAPTVTIGFFLALALRATPSKKYPVLGNAKRSAVLDAVEEFEIAFLDELEHILVVAIDELTAEIGHKPLIDRG
ncbi:MAG: hypothetical protein ACT4QB_18305 [Gammaproteobacteria bacterium]